ncbi:MAG: aminodeoxychorismate synthase component I [Solirubrobacterales bacterium]|nr:aminodeoxychorismate synthase component I [Solirubrobacterales bacterium]
MRVALEGAVPPGHEAQLVRGDARPFAMVGEWAGGGALVGSEPVRVAAETEDPFALLAERDEADGPADHFVGGGWFGYLGFELGVPGETPTMSPPSRERLPRFSLARYDHLLRLDAEGQWWFEAIWTGEREQILRERLETLRARLLDGPAAPGEFTTGPWRSDPSPQGHTRAVQACRERIAEGDLYQANIALRLRSTLRGDPIDLFTRAAGELTPDRAAYLADGRSAIASLSPELFLERRRDRVRSAPIKGTRPRVPDPEAAAATRDELARSRKDRAENTMIVDLVRNDLGRVCLPGSVKVTALAEPRAHPGVWHLVSEVEGVLRPEVDDAALLAGTFPPGSVTGAPKLAAIEAIAELESSARQVFTGAIGFSSPFAGLELNVAIRTFEIRGERIWLDAGGGIVADSDPGEEAAEASTKAQPLLDSIGASREAESPVGEEPPVLRLGPRPVGRPDPAAGVFETTRVSDGVPVHLEDHLTRLRASVAELYGEEIPGDLAERIATEAGATRGDLRLRIDFVPGREIETTFTPHVDLPEPVMLAPVTLPGGLGPHKWRDRRLLDALAEAVSPAVPLLVDLDGNLLEAAWANVLVTDADGGLTTPPADGRILPGVGRQRLIELGHEGRDVTERTVTLDELRASGEAFLVNSLRGLLPARLSR